MLRTVALLVLAQYMSRIEIKLSTLVQFLYKGGKNYKTNFSCLYSANTMGSVCKNARIVRGGVIISQAMVTELSCYTHASRDH